jgi:hypothetical protein
MDFIERANRTYAFYEIKNKEDVFDDSVNLIKSKKRMSMFIRQRIDRINRNIDSYNKEMKEINSDYQLKRIQLPDLDNKLSVFFEKSGLNTKINEKVFIHIQNSFNSYLAHLVEPLREQIIINRNISDREIESFGIQKINPKYHERLYEVVDLFLFGYKTTSVLVLGTIFEEVVTKYMLKLKKQNKITLKRNQILKMRFADKLNFMKSNGFIGEKNCLVISKLKFDRNVGGHFKKQTLRKQVANESGETIKLCLKILRDFDKKT